MPRRSHAEEAAAEFLARHGVTVPPVDVEELVRADGIQVARAAAQGGEVGFLLLREDGDWQLIGVNSKLGPLRERVSIAHSLGHLLLHTKQLIVCYQVRWNPRDEVTTLGTGWEEEQANLFAAELLMPRAMVTAMLRELLRPDWGRADVAQALAVRFQVSKEAMTYRLVSLGVVSA